MVPSSLILKLVLAFFVRRGNRFSFGERVSKREREKRARSSKGPSRKNTSPGRQPMVFGALGDGQGLSGLVDFLYYY